MDFEKYKYFYTNGCSHVEGGGLEEESITKQSVIPIYKKKYNVTWNNRSEVNFGKRLEEIINVKCINEAKCGGSAYRVVRMTYEFIDKNWNDRDKFFIILEKPDPSRYELLHNKEYYICNTIQNDIKKTFDFSFATRNYYNELKYSEDKQNQKIFSEYHNNFFDYEDNLKKMDFAFTGLYSFCKRNNIKIFLMMGNDFYFNKNYDNEDIIRFEENRLSDIHTFCKDKKLTITDETDGEMNDFHPGYFGHIEYAKQLYNFLKNSK